MIEIIPKIERTVIVIPARLDSTRLPNKILADINGKPMIVRVLEQCSKANGPEKIILCTDDKNLCSLVHDLGFESILTKKNCESGSERISSVLDQIIKSAWGKNQRKESIPFDVNEKLIRTGVINVQGDQPLLDPSVISKMDQFMKNESNAVEVVTPVHKLNKNDIHNPAVVKTLISNNRAVYFSRAALPYIRDVDQSEWHKHFNYWGHVGIYGYRGIIIKGWNEYAPSYLEKLEKLEQLRLIEANIKISTFEVEGNFISVDTYEQLEQVRKLNIKT